MPRASIKVTDFDALEAYGKEKGYPDLVKVVTKKEENKSQLRKLVHASLLMKTTIPGVTVEFKNKADERQTDIEKKIEEVKGADSKLGAPLPLGGKTSAPVATSTAKPATHSSANQPIKKKA